MTNFVTDTNFTSKDLHFKIFSYLNTKDRLSASCVGKSWYHFVNEDLPYYELAIWIKENYEIVASNLTQNNTIFWQELKKIQVFALGESHTSDQDRLINGTLINHIATINLIRKRLLLLTEGINNSNPQIKYVHDLIAKNSQSWDLEAYLLEEELREITLYFASSQILNISDEVKPSYFFYKINAFLNHKGIDSPESFVNAFEKVFKNYKFPSDVSERKEQFEKIYSICGSDEFVKKILNRFDSELGISNDDFRMSQIRGILSLVLATVRDFFSICKVEYMFNLLTQFRELILIEQESRNNKREEMLNIRDENYIQVVSKALASDKVVISIAGNDHIKNTSDVKRKNASALLQEREIPFIAMIPKSENKNKLMQDLKAQLGENIEIHGIRKMIKELKLRSPFEYVIPEVLLMIITNELEKYSLSPVLKANLKDFESQINEAIESIIESQVTST